MRQILPPGISQTAFDSALQAFAAVVGEAWVFNTDQDRDTYLDHFGVDQTSHVGAAAIAPLTTEEVQALVRLANEHKIPLWPISPRHKFQPACAEWAVSHAQAMLTGGCLNNSEQLALFIKNLNNKSIIIPGSQACLAG